MTEPLPAPRVGDYRVLFRPMTSAEAAGRDDIRGYPGGPHRQPARAAPSGDQLARSVTPGGVLAACAIAMTELEVVTVRSRFRSAATSASSLLEDADRHRAVVRQYVMYGTGGRSVP